MAGGGGCGGVADGGGVGAWEGGARWVRERWTVGEAVGEVSVIAANLGARTTEEVDLRPRGARERWTAGEAVGEFSVIAAIWGREQKKK